MVPQASQNRRRTEWVLAASLGLNLVLLWALGIHRQWAPNWPWENSKGERLAEAGTRPVFAALPKNSIPPIHRSTPWSRLASTNFLEFADRLRRAGCPDQTVCDILTPQIHDYFESQIVQLDYVGPYWALGDERRRLQTEAAESKARAKEEEAKWVETLGCFQSREFLDHSSLTWIVGGFLGADRFRHVMKLISGESEFVRQWDERTDGVLLPEERAQLLARRAEFETELNRWLTPQEQKEIQLRIWVLMRGIKSDSATDALGMSSHEYREFCEIQAGGRFGLHDYAANYPRLLQIPEPLANPRQQAAALQQLLGEERYWSYRHQLDPHFESVQTLARESGLDPTVAAAAFAEVEAFQTQWVPEARRQWATNPAAGLDQLRELRHQFQERLTQHLGELPEDKMQTLLEQWLNDAIREGWSQP